MRSRLSSLIPFNALSTYFLLEATLIGVFFIQALRFLIGSLYARVGSASQYNALDPNLIDTNLLGLVQPSTISNEISLLVYLLALPLIALIIGRFNGLLFLGAIMTAVGRYLMIADTSLTPTVAASIAVAGGLLYITLLIRHRLRIVPLLFIMGLSIDQIIRAFGNTLDPTWDSDYVVELSSNININYLDIQTLLSLGLVVLSLYTVITQYRLNQRQTDSDTVNLDRGLMPFWGGLGLGGLLFIELSLLTLPNAIIGRAGYTSYTSYPYITPILIVATALPLIPFVRLQARRFVALFDVGVRGWAWMLIIALLIVLGIGVQGIIGLITLVVAQFLVSMSWWWLARPQATKERNLTGLWIIVAVLIFGLLIAFDIFTYEYAFVRDFAEELNFLNPIIPPLLRGFRGMGLVVILLSVFLALLPMIQTRKRIAWTGGKGIEMFHGVIVILIMATIGTYASRPITIQGVNNPETIRVATYNIHAGYNEFFNYDLDAIANTIERSGADVVLLQEIETGRMTSFGVDQVLWLARHLEMDARFYAVNEGLQGLAVLSRVEIVFDDGTPLESLSTETGLQRVQIRPDQNIVTLYNTWLSPLLQQTQNINADVQEFENDQQNQMRIILNTIASQISGQSLRSSRTILGGTFNNVPDSDLFTEIRTPGGTNTPLFADPFAGINLQLSATYVRTDQIARLDYLWTTSGLRVEEAGTIANSQASDHRLAVIVVRLQ